MHYCGIFLLSLHKRNQNSFKNMTFNKDLAAYINEKVLPAARQIPSDRKKVLTPLVELLKGDSASREDALQLIFICTHNSRRSHLSQLWAGVAGAFYGIRVATYSGGTEATAFNPRAVKAVADAGFEVKNPGGENPHYLLKAAEDLQFEAFSKRFDDPVNPSSDFVAVMTCSDADEACPFVPGASKRIRLLYLDPKAADDTPQEEERYAERCLQIASELFYAFEKATEK